MTPSHDGVAMCARLIDRAIKTLHALPEERPRGYENAWPEVLQAVHDAYGYTEARRGRFRPTPHDVSVYLDVLKWLTVHEKRNDGKRDVRIIVAAAWGVPWTTLAAKYGRHPRTIRRWYDGAVTSIYLNNVSEVELFSR